MSDENANTENMSDENTNTKNTTNNAANKGGRKSKAKGRDMSYTENKKATDSREYVAGTYREIEGGLTIVDI